MSKNKNNQAIWNSRIKKKASTLYQKIGGSIDIDKRLYKEDILGSVAHIEMLFKQKIVSFKVKNKIIYGLKKIEKEIFFTASNDPNFFCKLFMLSLFMRMLCVYDH